MNTHPSLFSKRWEHWERGLGSGLLQLSLSRGPPAPANFRACAPRTKASSEAWLWTQPLAPGPQPGAALDASQPRWERKSRHSINIWKKKYNLFVQYFTIQIYSLKNKSIQSKTNWGDINKKHERRSHSHHDKARLYQAWGAATSVLCVCAATRGAAATEARGRGILRTGWCNLVHSQAKSQEGNRCLLDPVCGRRQNREAVTAEQ